MWLPWMEFAAVLTVASWAVFSKGLNLTIPLLPTIFGAGA